MNKRKELLLAIFAVVFVSPIFTEDNVNTREQQEEIAELFEKELYKNRKDKQLSAFDECIRTNSDDCALVIEHLKKARDYRAKGVTKKENIELQEEEIKELRSQFSRLRLCDPELGKPIQKMIDEAQSACPDCFKHIYWDTLSPSDKSELAQAAESLSLKNKTKRDVAYNITMLYDSLNQ